MKAGKFPEAARAIFLMRNMQIGDVEKFYIPVGQPQHRDTYKSINAAAYRILGSGSYSLRAKNLYLYVTRVS